MTSGAIMTQSLGGEHRGWGSGVVGKESNVICAVFQGVKWIH